MNPADEIKTAFGKTLDRHGYGFQYSVLRRVEEVNVSGISEWVLEACEFPVEVQGTGTRIDFILRSSRVNSFLLIAECKRADPKFSHWCFIRAPVVRRGRSSEHFFADRLEWIPDGVIHVGPEQLRWPVAEKAYHIGLAVKDRNAASESTTSERDAIEKAATQVCRGVNGLIETMRIRPHLLIKGDTHRYEGILIPVVLTTAKLYVCEYDLSKADIHTGHCNISDDEFTETPWLFFQYHLSPGIKHRVASDTFGNSSSVADLLDCEYVRTIPIVSADGIGPFLSKFKPWCQGQSV